MEQQSGQNVGRFSTFATVLLCLLLGGCGWVRGCPSQVEVGQLHFVEEPRTSIDASVEKKLAVEVTNPSNVPLDYEWRALRGKFQAATSRSPENLYQAPVEPGLDTITIDVRGGGAPIQKTLLVEVLPARVPDPKEFAYTFDTGTDGWAPNETAGTAGLLRLAHSPSERVGAKGGSLQLELDIDGRVPSKASAEVEVNLTHAGNVVSDPFDLRNRTIVLYVKFPAEFPLRTNAPHGIQPFAKDDNHRNYYGCYRNVDVVGKWIRVTFQPGPPSSLPCASDTKAWRQDPGFSAGAVTSVGLKIGANTANRAYRGAAFLDDVSLSR